MFTATEQGERLPMADQAAFTPAKEPPRSGFLLVVDDNEMNRDMLSRRIQRQGHHVEVATNGLEALAMLRAKAFDLVLLDIMMPEMNGYEVLETMKSDGLLSHIPVIMITAVDEVESVARCIELGAEDYLPKPFNPILLKARIGASLEKKWLRDQQEAYTLQLDRENRRKSDELEQARQIQLSMLPTAPPKLSHLEIAALQKTASEVGGDYYDFFPQPNGKLYVAIGDATGHGVGSGLMVAMTKASLMATNETDVPTLLGKINNILTRIDLGKQLNMALLLLEISEMHEGCVAVRASSGGIPPIYILRNGSNIVEEVIISGLPLGITSEAAYTSTEFSLASGDAMLLMSDGLPEMFNPKREILNLIHLGDELRMAELGPVVEAETRRWNLPYLLAILQRSYGAFYTEQGEWAKAEAAFNRALQVTRGKTLWYQDARTWLDYSRLLARRNQPGDADLARDFLSEAQSMFLTFGAHALAEKAWIEAARLG